MMPTSCLSGTAEELGGDESVAVVMLAWYVLTDPLKVDKATIIVESAAQRGGADNVPAPQ